ncbi:MAG: GntR family transcriptional regulator [Alphaproteobacteria bacterium]
MDSIDGELVSRISGDILKGSYEDGERLSEAKLCDVYKVSRTPVRLALRMLERQGLIKRNGGRGYFVHSPTVADILQAVQVRGHLESLAARLTAQLDNRSTVLGQLGGAIDEIDRLIKLGNLEEKTLKSMQVQNANFHRAILENCGNGFVRFSCDRISHLPMLGVGAMVFDRHTLSSPDGVERGIFRLQLGNSQHKVIFEAIEKGDGVRAEGMMREHANTMIEYIEVFEKRQANLTVSDLISYSGYDLTHAETLG